MGDHRCGAKLVSRRSDPQLTREARRWQLAEEWIAEERPVKAARLVNGPGSPWGKREPGPRLDSIECGLRFGQETP
jgi:hypothetical protein